MPEEKINLKKIRIAAAAVGIFSVAELARKASCSRTCIYNLADQPRKQRSSKARNRIKELIHV